MLLTLLQFFATKFLVLALHLEAGSFPKPLSAREEVETFAALRAGDPTALTLSDVLQDGFCMEDSCEQQDEARRLRQLIEGLPARERKLILLRYGLAGQPPLTQLETAKLLQISYLISRLSTEQPRFSLNSRLCFF